jgi:oligo-1,6-glucosidase
MKSAWWKESVVYQIYPRSFYDSNGDGIGDLRGIIRKVDHLAALGVDVVWLCPVYKSPNDDNGYDISNYRDIMDAFGTLADWEELRDGLHARGIKLVMDLVVNHTSDEHPWFVESRKSRDNPYRDYYIWRPPKHGREPNNWRSHFGGSAWQIDEATGEYYLHLFSRKQPDLNWENPRVRAEVYDLMEWWLQRGIDGFRMDVINMLSKVQEFPDAPQVTSEPYQYGGRYYVNGPRLLEYLHEMKRNVLSKYDILTVGETPSVTTRTAIELTNEETGALNMVFQFEHMHLDAGPGEESGRQSVRPWRLRDLKRVMTRWQRDLEGRGWNSVYLTNHDQPRAVSRFGNDGAFRMESAKLLATFTLLLKGTPYIYQGEEIGMTNVAFESIADYRDIETRNTYRQLVDKGLDPQAALAILHAKSRDNARTPMQWDESEHAGFTDGVPWIRVNPNYRQINVRQALSDPGSVFHYYRRLIALRKSNPAMVYGVYDLILEEDEAIYAFTRTLEDDRLLVILNFGAASPVFTLPASLRPARAELLIGNYEVDPADDLRQSALRPYEARVYRLRPEGVG